MSTKVEEALGVIASGVANRDVRIAWPGQSIAELDNAGKTLARHIAKQDATIARLTELAEVADGIISVCGGDAWERECTESERAEYARLRAELFPQPEEFPAYWPLGNHRPQPTPCELCGCMLKTEEGRRQHLRDKHRVPWEATKHAAALNQEK